MIYTERIMGPDAMCAQPITGSGIENHAIDPLIGEALDDRFLIEERIGVGGMGRVYRAKQIPIGRAVAVKVAIPTFAIDQDPNFIKRFSLEASITAKLSHPNTITIFDYGTTATGLVFLAMEYLQGQTLQQYVAAHGPQPAARAVHIAAQIARSLSEAHDLGVIHRDLKPSNVMLLRQGDDDCFVKVLDFGLVKYFGAPAEWETNQDLTQEGLLVGSPHYIAPEQAHGHSDQRSDIYSLGVVMFQTLTGRTPFHGRSSVETIMMHLRDPIPNMVSSPSQPIPDDVEAIVRRMLAKQPQDRFQSMHEVLEAFKRCSVADISGSYSGTLRAIDADHSRLSPPPLPRTSFNGRGELEDSRFNSVPLPSDGYRSLAATKVDVKSPGLHTLKRRILFDVITVLLALTGAGLVLFKVYWNKRVDSWAVIPAVSTKTVSEPAAPTVNVESVAQMPGIDVSEAQVTFHVRSEPAGASVLENGRLLGRTPFDITRPRGEAPVVVQLKFMLNGYNTQTVQGRSQGDDQVVTARLTRIQPSATKPAHNKPNNKPASQPGYYKEDPY